MVEISKLNLDGTDREIKDAVARGKLTVVDPTAGEGLITFGVDANGNYGYKKVGADTVTPFNSGSGSNIHSFGIGFEGSANLTILFDDYYITVGVVSYKGVVLIYHDNNMNRFDSLNFSNVWNTIATNVPLEFPFTMEFSYSSTLKFKIKMKNNGKCISFRHTLAFELDDYVKTISSTGIGSFTKSSVNVSGDTGSTAPLIANTLVIT